MVHSIKTEQLIHIILYQLKKEDDIYYSEKMYIVGDTLFFQETRKGVCTGRCISLVVESFESYGEGFNYKLI